MSEGMSYKQIGEGHEAYSSLKSERKAKAKKKALEKKKGDYHLTGRSQKEQMRFTRQNREYQKKFGIAWND